MTREELTTRLREPFTMIRIDAQSTMFDAADRLDRYRDIIMRCEWRLPCSAMRDDIAVLRRDIQESIE